MITNEQFDQWIIDLRSGNFKQTKHFLKNKSGHCCLGVLAERLLPEDKKDGCYTNTLFKFDNFTTTILLPPYIISESMQRTLSEMNDSGVPFNEIADYIEEHREEFVK